jgi:FkbM family methyltransferase
MVSMSLEESNLLKVNEWYRKSILSKINFLRGSTRISISLTKYAVSKVSRKKDEYYRVEIKGNLWRNFTEIDLVRKYCRIEYSFSKKLIQAIKKDCVFYDIGAYNGFHTIIGTIGREVYSFEPDPQNIRHLEKNVKLNSDQMIKIVEKPVWDSEEKISLETGKGGKSSIGNGDLEKKSIQLDSFIERENSAPDVMKIDVEGAEYKALQGMSNTLVEHGPKLFIEVHKEKIKKFGAQHEDVKEFLEDKGYVIENEHTRGSQVHLYAEPVDQEAR